jgi:hypothetical protein
MVALRWIPMGELQTNLLRFTNNLARTELGTSFLIPIPLSKARTSRGKRKKWPATLLNSQG